MLRTSAVQVLPFQRPQQPFQTSQCLIEITSKALSRYIGRVLVLHRSPNFGSRPPCFGKPRFSKAEDGKGEADAWRAVLEARVAIGAWAQNLIGSHVRFSVYFIGLIGSFV